jgi:U3 small nucleolar RNA-associated protein 5
VSSTSHVANFRALKTEKPKKKKKKKRFAHVAADGRVRVFESDNGEMLAEMHHKNNLKHKPTSVAFAPAPAAQQDVRQQKKKKKKKKKILLSKSTNSTCNSNAQKKRKRKGVDEASSLIAVGCASGVVLLFEATKATLEKTIRTSHSGAVRSVVFADDGNVLYIGGNDRRVVEWSVTEHAEQRSWIAEDGPVAALAVANAGDVIATASNTVTLWDRASLSKLVQFTGHASLTRLLVFAPGDQLVISAARDRYVSLWPTTKAPANAPARLCVNDALPVTLIAPHAAAAADNFRFGVVDANGAAVFWNVTAAAAAGAATAQSAQRSQTLTVCSRVASSPNAPLLHARLRVDSDNDTQVVVARGSTARPKLQSVPLRGDGPQHQLLVAVSLDAIADASTTTTTANGAAKPARPSVLGAESLPLRNGADPLLGDAEHDIELLQQLARDEENVESAPASNEPTLAERLAQSAGDQRKRGGDKTGSKDALTLQADSLQSMLTQALQSDDRALLDEVLAVSDATIINNTLRRLPAQSVLPLLSACVRLFHGKPRRAMALALWLRSLLACHAAYLASLPDLTTVSVHWFVLYCLLFCVCVRV